MSCRAIAWVWLTMGGVVAQQPETWRTLLVENGVADRGWSWSRGRHVDLLAAPLRIDGFAAVEQVAPMPWCLERLEAAYAAVALSLGRHAAAMPATLRVVLATDERALCRLCRGLVGDEAQALGAFGGKPPTLVLLVPPVVDAATLRRLLTHSLAAQLVAGLGLDRAGHGWLAAGVAHAIEARLGDGLCENFVLQDHPQTARRFHGGEWRIGTRELLEAGTLPGLADVVGRAADEFDFAQHALAFAFVEYLQQSPPVVTGQAGASPPFEQLFDPSGLSTAGAKRLQQVFGKDLTTLERELHAFVRARYPRR